MEEVEMSGPRLALVFPGQGARHPGMGRLWAGRPGWFLAGRASEVSGRDVEELLLRADGERLSRTGNAQLATFVLEMVILDELRRVLPAAARPRACAGHGVGEYAALVAAGIVDFDDAVRLVTARGEAMSRAAREAYASERGAMAAVLGLSAQALHGAAESVRADGGRVWVAGLDSPRQTVLSGEARSVDRCCAVALEMGADRIEPVQAAGAFHTPLMAPAAAAFAGALARTEFRTGFAPVVANADARPHHGPGDWPGLLETQLTGPVMWSDSVKTMADGLYCDMVVEVGPGRTLTALARQTAPWMSRLTIGEPGQLPAVPGTFVPYAPVRDGLVRDGLVRSMA
ncbi:ACP S-malonyltransferase [Streptomyces sp. NPDC059443]|uniref:ACP S-malonyltransferase n=1 Tax=unclassified Streptomyces TaxID=2593676 RepID=UPI0036AAA321